MNKICIISQNKLFAEDFSAQLKLFVPETDIVFDDDDDCDVFFIDEDEAKTKKISITYKTKPIVYFTSKSNTIDYVDVVIQKPFSLIKVLDSIKENTLLPKVRHKECIVFKEYSFYPVKKEISSLLTGKTTKLTEKEVKILKYLYNNTPNTVNKEDLLQNVWGYSVEMSTHTIETHIYRLRQKVEQDCGTQIIITESSGYRLNV